MKEAAPWIFASGVFNLTLAVFHISFWRLFGWPRTLSGSGEVNRSVTQILNLAIAYLFLLSAAVCFLFPLELATTALGRFWLFAMTGFWAARAIIQPPFFGLRNAFSITIFGVFIAGAVLHGISWALVS